MDDLLLGLILSFLHFVMATIDINMSEYQHIANRLSLAECRKLVASLQDSSYQISDKTKHFETILPAEVNCIDLLLSWNDAEDGGKGQTHVLVSRRLHQLGHSDLASWLSKTVFHDLSESARHAGERNLPETNNETAHNLTRAVRDDDFEELDIDFPEEDLQDDWTLLDSGLLFFVFIAVVFSAVRWYWVMKETFRICRKPKTRKYENDYELLSKRRNP